MKTLLAVVGLFVALTGFAADSTIHALPAGGTLSDSDVGILDRQVAPAVWNNKSFTFLSLKSYVGTNGVFVANYITVQNITNNNLYTTNLTVQNFTVASNSYTTNILITTDYNYYPETFITNNTVLSNYWTTNIFTDTYVSNYFLDYVFFTNTFYTNVYYTNVLTYTFPTNYYFTNIVNNNNYVSNYFWTNVYNTAYFSNYYYYTNYLLSAYTNYYTNTFLVSGPYIANLAGLGTNVGLVGLTVIADSNFVAQAGFDGVQLWANNLLVNNTATVDELDATEIYLSGVANRNRVLGTDALGKIVPTNITTVVNFNVESNLYVTNLVTAKTAFFTNIIVVQSFINTNYGTLATATNTAPTASGTNQWVQTLASDGSVTNTTGPGWVTYTLKSGTTNRYYWIGDASWVPIGDLTSNLAPSGVFFIPSNKTAKIDIENLAGQTNYSCALQRP